MAKRKLVKSGDRTIVVGSFGEFMEVSNRVLNTEANLAAQIILADQSDRAPGAVVERAFSIAKLTMQHIKDHKMDTPFPFKKVYGDADQDH